MGAALSMIGIGCIKGSERRWCIGNGVFVVNGHAIKSHSEKMISRLYVHSWSSISQLDLHWIFADFPGNLWCKVPTV